MTGDQIRNDFSGAAGFVFQGRDFNVIIHRPAADVPAEQRIAYELAVLVRDQWRTEIGGRDIFNPEPLPTVWTVDTSRSTNKILNKYDEINELNGDVAGLVTAFRTWSRHRLLLLGEAGAGKTTMALLLLFHLLSRQTADDPVPVLLPLNSWDTSAHRFEHWLEQYLTEQYPQLRRDHGPDAVARLLRARLVLPILDGLDEMPKSVRSMALGIVNQWLMPEDSTILTCRTSEYDDIANDEELKSAIVLRAEPVNPNVVCEYLRVAASTKRQDRWEPVFNSLHADDKGVLAQALSTPLTIWLVRRIYARSGTNPAELLDAARFPSRAAIEHHLFDELVPTVFGQHQPSDTRRKSSWKPDQAKKWLEYLAAHSAQLNTRDLAWWDLRRSSKVRAAILVWPLIAIVTTSFLVLAATYGYASLSDMGHQNTAKIANDTMFSIWYGLVIGYGAAAIDRLTLGRYTPSTSRWTHRRWISLLTISAVGFPVVSRLFLTPTLARSLVTVTVDGAIALAITRDTIRSRLRNEAAATPDYRLARDRARYVYTAMAHGGLAALVCTGLDISTGAFFAAIPMTAAALPIGAVTATVGDTWWHWVMAKLCMSATGRLPWSLMSFLQDAHHLGVLRRIGPVYQFRHITLHRRLAKDSDTQSTTEPGSSEFVGRVVLQRPRVHPGRWLLLLMAALSSVPLISNGLHHTPSELPLLGLAAICGIVALVFRDIRRMQDWEAVLSGQHLPYWELNVTANELTLYTLDIENSISILRLTSQDIDRIVVRRIRTELNRETRYFALHVRLTPDADEPGNIRRDPDGWYPLFWLGRDRNPPPDLGVALVRFAGWRWEAPLRHR